MAHAQLTYFNQKGDQVAQERIELPYIKYEDAVQGLRFAFRNRSIPPMVQGWGWNSKVDFDGHVAMQPCPGPEYNFPDNIPDGPVTLLCPIPEVTFKIIRHFNVMRLPHFKNKLGKPAHQIEDGSDWSPGDWLTTICGEAGEACGEWKKFLRGEVSYDDFVDGVMKELADIVHYCDLTAFQFRRDLGEAVRSKYNEISDRIGVNFKIPLN